MVTARERKNLMESRAAHQRYLAGLKQRESEARAARKEKRADAEDAKAGKAIAAFKARKRAERPSVSAGRLSGATAHEKKVLADVQREHDEATDPDEKAAIRDELKELKQMVKDRVASGAKSATRGGEASERKALAALGKARKGSKGSTSRDQADIEDEKAYKAKKADDYDRAVGAGKYAGQSREERQRGTVMTGAKGGRYYETASGKKVYVKD